MLLDRRGVGQREHELAAALDHACPVANVQIVHWSPALRHCLSPRIEDWKIEDWKIGRLSLCFAIFNLQSAICNLQSEPGGRCRGRRGSAPDRAAWKGLHFRG